MASIITNVALCAIFITQCLSASTLGLPTIDLGYNLQQPTSLNLQYTPLYVFYDIRYASPPTGKNRFRAPQPPAINRTAIQKGGQQRICAQASPNWQPVAGQFFPKYQAGQTIFEPSDFTYGTPNTTPSSRETEDCLFLDVYATKSAVDSAVAGKSPKLPVIVQIYGGGYIAGAKDLNPGGLFIRDKEQGGSGLVVVSMNYRLGAFGWLAGSSFQKDGDANAGLLDQRYALQWVQKYISKFGGDPNNVTVIGESAGGGSIMHQVTAYGGSSYGSTPFKNAIVQSPGFYPVDEDVQSEKVFCDFLKQLNVSTISQARALSFNQVYAANAVQVGIAPYGKFTYGPAVDGSFVPQLPSKLLADGRFDHTVAVMVGHNADEGIGFTSPFVQNDTSFKQTIATWLPPPVATQSNLDYIANTMYPPVFDGTYGYTNQIARTDVALTELLFTCSTFYLDTAFQNQTYAYLFAVPPAVHGMDVAFTYYSGATLTTDPQQQVAVSMQKYFLEFAKTRNPNASGLPTWTQYTSNAQELVFNTTGNLKTIRDGTANSRCNWYQANL